MIKTTKVSANQTNLRRGGFYWIGNKPYLSTTEILKVIDKPALRYWYGQEVFYAMCKDPKLNEREALSAPYQSGKKAAGRGTTVHSLVEAYKNTGQVIENVPDDFKGYAQAFYDFMNEVKPELIEQEKTAIDEENSVAGTLDIYGKIGSKHYVLDIKTGKDIYAESSLQLSQYAHSLRLEGKPVDAIGVVLLETGADKLPTGKYKFAVQTEAHDVFLHAKALYEWQNKEKLLKIGYLK